MRATNYEDELWAAIYDQYNSGRHQEELAFYASEVRDCQGPVLEMACGTGMILLKLLEQGVDIYGLDISAEMLNVLYAKAEASGVPDIRDRVWRQDMRRFESEHCFEAIIIPNRSFLHLTEQEDQIACLKSVYAHLKPGGRLLLNFFDPRLDLLVDRSKGDPAYRSVGVYVHPRTAERVEVCFKQVNDLRNQVQHLTWRFDVEGSVHETSMDVRWIYPEEFKLLLRVAGFQKWAVYGDFDRSPFPADAGEMIWVAER